VKGEEHSVFTVCNSVNEKLFAAFAVLRSMNGKLDSV